MPAGVLLAYDRDLFSAETIARTADHLRVLLAAAVLAPSLPLRSLPMLGADEQSQLRQWAEPQGAPPLPPLPGVGAAAAGGAAVVGGSPMVLMFDAQAARTPKAPALEVGGDVYSYEQVWRGRG